MIGFEGQSGRVISFARMSLASLFLLAVYIDPTQPAYFATPTYLLLAVYVLVSAGVAAATWNDWWLDSRLAGPIHILDIAVFTALVYVTAGYTSPFFVFFVFVLLSAAIRWGWRETAVTAFALVILYFGAGWAVAVTSLEEFELQRFIVRASHLIILSLLLIWFGVHQSRAAAGIRHDELASGSTDESMGEVALHSAASWSRAPYLILLWRDYASGQEQAIVSHHGEISRPIAVTTPLAIDLPGPILYDLEADRLLLHQPERPARRMRALRIFDHDGAKALQLRRGLAIPVSLETGSGTLFLQGLHSLSTDHLSFGADLAQAVQMQMRRHALLHAVEEGGETRARLSLARDLHDSVVQFLAGIGFRIEAMIRKTRQQGDVENDLQELKSLTLQEQRDLRSYIGALRGDREISFDIAVAELEALTEKLANQWEISCEFSAATPNSIVPVRFHLDCQQLIREAVANAVRHGKAKKVNVLLYATEQALELRIGDDGKGMGHSGDGRTPRSLSERVADAGGQIDFASGPLGTSLTISLPWKRTRS